MSSAPDAIDSIPDVEKSDIRHVESGNDVTLDKLGETIIDQEAERRLVRKLDFW